MSQSHLYLGRSVVKPAESQVETRLPMQLAVPFILATSLALWVVIWIIGSWGAGLLHALLGAL